ncbi:MAG TPA: hypothetical protein VF250_03485 [Conexibacter sp.]
MIAAVGATAVMALAIGSASARNFSISNQQIRAVWNPMNFIDPFGVTVECPVTLEGSLHSRTIAKVSYALIGYITTARVSNERCVGGEATILNESLPWHVRYFGFVGTLPDITRILTLISGASFRVRTSATCLFTLRETTAEHGLGTFNRNTTTGQLTSVDVGGEITSNEACAFGLRVRGRLEKTSISLRLLNTNELIFVRLI